MEYTAVITGVKIDNSQLKLDLFFCETLCSKQMLVHTGGQIKNWSGEFRDVIPTKLQCQTIQGDYSTKII